MAAGEFARKVLKIVHSVPRGKVVSYGQVALLAGLPRAARNVGWILRQAPFDFAQGKQELPWWRVINNQGRISIKGNWEHEAEEQRELLLKDGVEVSDNYEVDIEKYRYLAE